MRARQIPLAALAAAALATGAAGCGDDDSSSTTTAAVQGTQAPPAATEPTASAPDASPPAPPTVTDAIPTSTVPAPPRTTPTPAEEQGGGGEEAVRVPATYRIRAGRLTPPSISVPPRLAVELTVVSDDSAHVVVLRAPEPQTLNVPAGGRASLRMPGLRAGSYELTLDGEPAGELVAGGEVGP